MQQPRCQMQRKEWCKFLNKRLVPLTAGMFCTAHDEIPWQKVTKLLPTIFRRSGRVEQENGEQRQQQQRFQRYVTIPRSKRLLAGFLAKSLQRLQLQIVYRYFSPGKSPSLSLSLSLCLLSFEIYSYRRGWLTLAALARHFPFDKCVRRGIQSATRRGN